MKTEIGYSPHHVTTYSKFSTFEIQKKNCRHLEDIKKRLPQQHGTLCTRVIFLFKNCFLIYIWFVLFISLFKNLTGIFASGGSDGSIMFWSVGADKEVGAIEAAHESIVWALSWHPAGHILCSGKLQIGLLYSSN